MSERFIDLSDIEVAQGLHRFLMGDDPPPGLTLAKRPRKMTAEQSFSIIYLLQETYGVIPDSFELCSGCGWLFNSEAEGHTPDTGKFYCDTCAHLCKCEDCKRK